MTVVDYLSLR